uniref:NAD(P)H-quinone oxidoreductase chain 4, chloroplastic n=1 Tax=Nephroselmis astigmatica TaxID=259378 RepID=A0A088CIG7_9CHLO|nr:subunit 4 of NADH-plastoquinone oxidoreductase [Nephroselmis astigmatica]AID67678.1 subunit 4 of NADH-plastoquinone oxidoreductase [Nephroselmis astigmatica]
MADFPWLTTIVLFPVTAGLLIPLLPDNRGTTIRWYSLAVSLIDFILIVYVFGCHYNFDEPSLQLIEDFFWINSLNLHWSLGVDGLSVPLILLTGFVTTLSMLAAWPVTKNPRLFYFLMLAMYSGQIGVFASQDILLFFLMWELELIPVYLLIAIWGGKKRLYASTKFILYTALASIFILIGGLSMAFYGNQEITFNMTELANRSYPIGLQILLYVGFLIAYGVKLSAFPVHTWLPDTHGEAHYSTCMLLAGILLKMGGYGLIRFNMGMLPEAHLSFAPWLIGIGVVNIIYAALTSFAQRNLKRKIAYSSVSHMGFVLIGIGSLSQAGLNGAMLQMISHGLIGASLFFLAGSTYDRTRTLILEELGGLAGQMPKTFALFTACALASLALPGMSGFLAELLVFLGLATSHAYSPEFRIIMTVLEAIGIILTPIYLLSMLRQVFYGPPGQVIPSQMAPSWGLKGKPSIFQDAGPRELFITASLLVPILAIGIYPKLTTELYLMTTNQIVDQILAVSTDPLIWTN